MAWMITRSQYMSKDEQWALCLLDVTIHWFIEQKTLRKNPNTLWKCVTQIKCRCTKFKQKTISSTRPDELEILSSFWQELIPHDKKYNVMADRNAWWFPGGWEKEEIAGDAKN